MGIVFFECPLHYSYVQLVPTNCLVTCKPTLDYMINGLNRAIVTSVAMLIFLSLVAKYITVCGKFGNGRDSSINMVVR